MEGVGFQVGGLGSKVVGLGSCLSPKPYSPAQVDRIWLWVYYITRSSYTPSSIYLRGTIDPKP